MIEIEKYARAAASTARTPPNSPARRAALEAENAARVAAEQFVKGLEAMRERIFANLGAHYGDATGMHLAVARELDSIRALPLPTGSISTNANRDLIAAAPDLLDALIHCATDEGPEQEWLNKARAAIAKATGAAA